MATVEEIKSLVEQGNRAFEEHKAAVDQRLKEIEQNGAPRPETEEKVRKIGETMDHVSQQLQDIQERQSEIEAASGRSGLGGARAPQEQAEMARQFFSMVRGDAIDGQPDVEAYNNYRHALTRYIRKGNAAGQGILNSLSVGSDPDGGYWVTPDMGGRIVQLIYETSPVRQVASVTTIGTDALEGPKDLDEADSGWVGESGARSETGTPQVGTWRIPVHEQYAEPRATQKLLDDASFDVEGWLNGKIADKLARRENTAFVNGDGNLKPRGFLTYPDGTPSKSTWDVIQRYNSGANGAFAASNPGDALVDMVFGLKGAYRNGAAWGMNRKTLSEVRKLKDGDGNYLWQPNFQEMGAASVLGFPVVEMEDMPDIANGSLSIAFGNFATAYQIVDRQGIRLLRDPFTAKPWIKFYTTKRVGGDVVNFEAMNLMQFSS